MHQGLRHSDVLALDTCDQDLVLLSSRNNRTQLHCFGMSWHCQPNQHDEACFQGQQSCRRESGTKQLGTEALYVGPSLRKAALLFGDFTGSLAFYFLQAFGAEHALPWPYAIQLYKFSCVYLPIGTIGKAPFQLSTFTEQDQEMNKVEKLTIQLQVMTCERNELRGTLVHCTNNDLNAGSHYAQFSIDCLDSTVSRPAFLRDRSLTSRVFSCPN